MTTAISTYTQSMQAIFPRNWISGICREIYDLAMKLFKMLKDCFSVTSNPPTTTITTAIVGNPRNLVAFYRGTEPNIDNVTLNQILSWDDGNLELVHTYIQWLFPLTESSSYNPTAPVFDQATIQTFRNDAQLKGQVLRSFRRMLTFYGLQMNDATRIITRAPNFNARAAVWMTQYNHNFLRITRIIRSLCLLGLREYAGSFLAIMTDIASNEGSRTVSRPTLQRWNQAAR